MAKFLQTVLLPVPVDETNKHKQTKDLIRLMGSVCHTFRHRRRSLDSENKTLPVEMVFSAATSYVDCLRKTAVDPVVCGPTGQDS